VGTGLRKADHLTVDRGSRPARLACAAAMVDTLRAGRSLLVYPEGRRSRAEGLLPFRLGAFRAAVDAGCPVVPITVRGTDAIVSTRRRWLRRGPIDLTIHGSIAPLGADRSEMVRIRERAREEIASSLGEPHNRHGNIEAQRE
jgi:1-acyl-sn-glycerol-3-phosphate acyltransferase